MKALSLAANSQTAEHNRGIRLHRILKSVNRGLLLTGFVGTAAAVVLMCIVEPQKPVAEVKLLDGGVQSVTTKGFQERLFFERKREEARRKAEVLKQGALWFDDRVVDYRYLSSLEFAGGVLARVTRETLIREAADRRGWSISDSEVDAYIKKAQHPAPQVTNAKGKAAMATMAAVSAVHSSAEVRGGLSAETSIFGVAREDLPSNYREIVRAEIFENRLREAFYREVPSQEQSVKLKLVRFEDRRDAEQSFGKLSREGSFSTFYDQVVSGKVQNATGTVRDWSSARELAGDFDPVFSAEAFALRVGESTVRVVAAAGGWYLLQSVGREVRHTSEPWRKQRGEDAYNDWLAQQEKRVQEFPIWMNRVPIDFRAFRNDDALALSRLGLPPSASGAKPSQQRQGHAKSKTTSADIANGSPEASSPQQENQARLREAQLDGRQKETKAYRGELATRSGNGYSHARLLETGSSQPPQIFGGETSPLTRQPIAIPRNPGVGVRGTGQGGGSASR